MLLLIFLFKVKVIPVTTVDPTVERLKMVKQAEEESRAEARREAMRQKMREKQLRKGISAGYLEDQEDDENSFSLNAIKVNIKNMLSRDIRVVQDAYNCSVNYGYFYYFIDCGCSTAHSTAIMLLDSKMFILFE